MLGWPDTRQCCFVITNHAPDGYTYFLDTHLFDQAGIARRGRLLNNALFIDTIQKTLQTDWSISQLGQDPARGLFFDFNEELSR